MHNPTTGLQTRPGPAKQNERPFKAGAVVRFCIVAEVQDDRAVEHCAISFRHICEGLHRAGDETKVEGTDLFRHLPPRMIVREVKRVPDDMLGFLNPKPTKGHVEVWRAHS